eukprot:403349605
MKASVDVVLFLVTVYDYFFRNNTAFQEIGQPQPDQPYHDDIENDSDGYTKASSLLTKNERKYKSVQGNNGPQRPSLFEDDDFGDTDANENGSSFLSGMYTRLHNDEQDLQRRQDQSNSLVGSVKDRVSRVWTGASVIMTRYAKRRNEMNRQTIEQSETLTNARDFIAQKSEQVQMKVSKLMHARRAASGLNNFKTRLDDFATL